MKIKDSFVTHTSDREQIMVDTSGHFAGLIRSNQTAAFIIDFLKNEHTKEEIVEALYAKYDAGKEILTQDTETILEKLREAGALEE